MLILMKTVAFERESGFASKFGYTSSWWRIFLTSSQRECCSSIFQQA